MIKIDGNKLKIDDLVAVARKYEKVQIAPTAIQKIKTCRKMILKMIDSGQMIYGVTTGIGELATVKVSPEKAMELQKRIVLSHAASVGEPHGEEVVRAAMLVRANVLSNGHSAVRPEIVQMLVDMLNKGVTPVVYRKGSVGTSGDLAPLSMIAEVVMGYGHAIYKGKKYTGAKALQLAGLKPIQLQAKEGLGLINGPQVFTAHGALALYDGYNLFKNALISSAMTLDALHSTTRAFDARAHKVRGYNGQQFVAMNLRKLLAGSQILKSPTGRVQDAYSLRCTPQVYGPSYDAMNYVRSQIEIELNAVSDNPLFFPKDGDHIAAGNFHGQPTAMALDFLCIALAELGDLSERHTNRLLNPALSGLPGFLVEGRGLNSGLMVAQYSAAALCCENRVNCQPAVVDNVSVSADQEDHICMGPLAAQKAATIVENTATILSIEMMSAAQAMDFRKPLKPGKGTYPAYKEIRKVVPFMKDDRSLHPDIKKIETIVRDCTIVNAVEKSVGKLF